MSPSLKPVIFQKRTFNLIEKPSYSRSNGEIRIKNTALREEKFAKEKIAELKIANYWSKKIVNCRIKDCKLAT